MSPDEVIDFLKDIEKGLGQREDIFPYVERYSPYYFKLFRYLELIVNIKDAPDRFFTLLGTIYIEKLFKF